MPISSDALRRKIGFEYSEKAGASSHIAPRRSSDSFNPWTAMLGTERPGESRFVCKPTRRARS